MRHLILAVLVSVSVELMPGCYAAESAVPPTEGDLMEATRALAVAETKADGIRRLVFLAGNQLLISGSLFLVSDDPVVDALQRRANRMLQANRDPEVVRQLLLDPERRVRLWAVHSCVSSHGQQEPWRPLIPLLKETAAQDVDAGVRAVAIDRLMSYGQLKFVVELAPKESSPWVLMKILGFSTGDAGRARWNQRAIAELLSDDAATRKRWLSDIYGNVWNPSTAPMWRVTADPGLLAALDQIVRDPDAEDAAMAAKAAHLLREQQAAAAHPDGQ